MATYFLCARSLRKCPVPVFRWLLLVTMVLGLGAISGCGGEPDPPAASPSTEGPLPGGTAVIALSGEPDVLNSLIRSSSYAGMVLAEMQDALAELGEDLQWYPRIAESWEIAEDRTAITYHLKPWVWSDGRPLTTRDVVSSFHLIRDDRVASPLRSTLEPVAGVTALDERTVRYTFRHPVADPVMRSAHALLPEHITRDLDPADVQNWKLNRAPLASGDFKLERWDHNRTLNLVRNELYPGPAALLDRVVFRVIPEKSSQVLALEAGEVDLVDGIPPATAKRLEKSGNIHIVDTSGRGFYYVVWNTRLEILADAPTRCALSLAIDRTRMIDTLLLGYGTPAASCIPPVIWNHHRSLAPDAYEPEEARRLLADAGWRDENDDGVLERDGRELRIRIITKQGDPVRENGIVMLREYLGAIGVAVEPLVLEHATGLARLRSGDFDAYFGLFNANLYGDPSGIVHSNAIVDGHNSGGYRNARVDSLIEAGLAEVDRESALPIWYKVQELIAADPPSAYLFYPVRLVGVSDRIQDVRPHLMSPFNNLSEWWIAPADRKYRSSSSPD